MPLNTHLAAAHQPPDCDVERVQARTGMDKLQAINHLRSLRAARLHYEEQHRAAVAHCLEQWALHERRVDPAQAHLKRVA